jgi:plasmid stabilization system protein ParE
LNAFELHPEVFADLDEVREYIANDNPDAADQFVLEIFEAIRSLVRQPHQGVRRPGITARRLRFKFVREYVIAYAPDKKPLWVGAVFHGRRNPRVIAAILRGRE